MLNSSQTQPPVLARIANGTNIETAKLEALHEPEPGLTLEKNRVLTG